MVEPGAAGSALAPVLGGGDDAHATASDARRTALVMARPGRRPDTLRRIEAIVIRRLYMFG
jgi:hypothetical protein